MPKVIEQLKGSSINQELPPRYDDYIDDAVDVMQEAHVVPDDVAVAPQVRYINPKLHGYELFYSGLYLE